MPISPQDIRAQQFKTVKRGGYDQSEVEAFRTAAAEALEQANQDATAMEARARAAVARVQELQQAVATGEPAAAPAPEAPVPEPEPARVAAEDAETITRTLLLAQRTADATVADASQEAAQILEAARAESRKAGEAERVRVEGEVQALLARRDFLESDVDHLEQFLDAQRERLNEVASELGGITSRIASGLAPMRRPQLSASNAEHAEQVETAAEVSLSEDDTGGLDVGSLIDQVHESDVDDVVSPDDAVVDHEIIDGDEPAPDERHTLFTPDDQR